MTRGIIISPLYNVVRFILSAHYSCTRLVVDQLPARRRLVAEANSTGNLRPERCFGQGAARCRRHKLQADDEPFDRNAAGQSGRLPQ